MIKRWICWGSILRENHIPGFYMVLRTWQPWLQLSLVSSQTQTAAYPG
jgi:hypothetical protein